jgi:mannose-6-phosphate isomerase-like protein (cupin superfamily)
VTAQPRNGPPPHVHHRETELFQVLEGEFAFTLGDRTFTRSKGFAACLPKGVLHTYNNVGARPGKMLVIAAPSGFERFVREWSHPVGSLNELAPLPSPRDVDKLLAAAPGFGIEIRPGAKAATDTSAPPADASYWVLGQFVTLKLNSRDTAGQFSVAEIICPPGTSVLNHRHVAMDELFYVLEGTAEFTFGDRVESVEKGGVVFIPRGEVHGFRNPGSAPVKLWDAHTPAGFEEFFQEAGVPGTNPNIPPPPSPLPDPEQLIPLLRKHGMELLMDVRADAPSQGAT